MYVILIVGVRSPQNQTVIYICYICKKRHTHETPKNICKREIHMRLQKTNDESDIYRPIGAADVFFIFYMCFLGLFWKQTYRISRCAFWSLMCSSTCCCDWLFMEDSFVTHLFIEDSFVPHLLVEASFVTHLFMQESSVTNLFMEDSFETHLFMEDSFVTHLSVEHSWVTQLFMTHSPTSRYLGVLQNRCVAKEPSMNRCVCGALDKLLE